MCPARFENFAGIIPSSPSNSIMEQFVSGVLHMHSHNVLHRDLKPANLLLHSTETAPLRVLVADFGFCTSIAHSHAETVEVMTPCYRAPEVEATVLVVQNWFGSPMSHVPILFPHRRSGEPGILRQISFLLFRCTFLLNPRLFPYTFRLTTLCISDLRDQFRGPRDRSRQARGQSRDPLASSVQRDSSGRFRA